MNKRNPITHRQLMAIRNILTAGYVNEERSWLEGLDDKYFGANGKPSPDAPVGNHLFGDYQCLHEMWSNVEFYYVIHYSKDEVQDVVISPHGDEDAIWKVEEIYMAPHTRIRITNLQSNHSEFIPGATSVFGIDIITRYLKMNEEIPPKSQIIFL